MLVCRVRWSVCGHGEIDNIIAFWLYPALIPAYFTVLFLKVKLRNLFILFNRRAFILALDVV